MSPSPGGASGAGFWAWRWQILGGLAIVALTVAAYFPALSAGFIWDDDLYVTNNPILRDPHGLGTVWTSPTKTPQFYPLVFTVFWCEYRLWGLNPLGYHAVNVMLHAANAIVLWVGLRRLGARWPWLVVALFAVHPVHVESVAWITELKNVLSGFFYLLSFLAYAAFDSLGSSAPPARRRWGLYAVSLVLFGLALSAKTVVCSLPAAIVLIMWWKRDRVRVADLVPLVPMFALGLAGAAMTVWVERHVVLTKDLDLGLSLADRIVLAGRAGWFYLHTLAWPTPLCFMYEKWRVDAGVWWQWLLPLAWFGAGAGLWAGRAKIGKAPLAAMLFFLGTLVPALGFVDVYPMRYSWVADHFQYLASIGPIALFSAAMPGLLARLTGAGGSHRSIRLWPGLLVPGLLIAGLGAAAFARAGAYSSLEGLWRDTLATNPGAWMAHNNLGGLLMVSGRLDEAERHLLRASELNPAHGQSLNNLGILYLARNDPSRGLEFARRAREVWPDSPEAWLTVSRCYMARGDHEIAVAQLREGTRRLPGAIILKLALAEALTVTGQDGAMEQYEAVLKLDPTNAVAAQKLRGTR